MEIQCSDLNDILINILVKSINNPNLTYPVVKQILLYFIGCPNNNGSNIVDKPSTRNIIHQLSLQLHCDTEISTGTNADSDMSGCKLLTILDTNKFNMIYNFIDSYLCISNFCNPSDSNKIIIGQSDLIKLLNMILFPVGINVQDICTSLKYTPRQEAADMISSLIGDYVSDSYKQKYIRPFIDTICPEPIEKPPQYNTKIIILVYTAIFIVGLIAYVIMTLINKKHIHNIYVVSIVIFVICFLLFIINPFCIFKACPKKTDLWVPTNGIYRGTKSYGSDVQFEGEIQIYSNNKIILNKLSCSGKYCTDPSFKDMIKWCVDQTGDPQSITGYIDVDDKTPYGFPIVSKCMEPLQKFKNLTGNSIINGIWAVYDNTKKQYSLQISFNPCLNLLSKPTCLQLMILIPFVRIGDNPK